MILYLTNASSVVAAGRGLSEPRTRVGRGRVWTIMARPRAHYGEAGVGRVEALSPPWAWVEAAKRGELPMVEYRARYEALLADRHLAPPVLAASRWPDGAPDEAVAGDTLICSCSMAAAAEGRCHRAWAARALLAAGWRVVLDGMELVQ